MTLENIREKIHPHLYEVLYREGISELRPAQRKSIGAGLLEGKNLLVCTPTASGKTLVAELAMLNNLLNHPGKKAVYIVPLKALASEKFRQFKKKYAHLIKIALSIGDLDSDDPYLANYDMIICTSEKFDSLIRHKAPWLSMVSVVIIDEIHLLNDSSRGPTLEILITILRDKIKNLQIIGLSATIGNPRELADWLGAELVIDSWRPVKLSKGIFIEDRIEFVKEKE
ncbi:MAG: DEAD/DEAH box helicase [Candidatus Woesearchaeota archaeon]|nr:DEAD/DEAH box helicase [Candidatus Woesearchaeota archaeon]